MFGAKIKPRNVALARYRLAIQTLFVSLLSCEYPKKDIN